MASKKKTTQTVDNKTTMTPTNPQQTTDLITGLTEKVTDTFKGLDPYSLVAPADPLQVQASRGAAGLGAGASRLSQLANGSLLDNVDAYRSKYEKDVRDTSLADFDWGAGKARGQAMLDLAGDSTFGGSGGSIYRAGLEGELNRGRGALSAGLNDQAWQRATGLAQSDRATQLAAAQGQGAEERANIDTQAQMGEINRLIEQMRREAPITALQRQTGIAGGIPLQLLTGQTGTETGKTVTTTSNPMGQIGGILSGLAGLASIPLTGGLSAGLGSTLGGSLIGNILKKKG